mmetsp:Transcript_7743/g.16777  ORF Transcript_7743/g.16777 Transcript_7743/m.16777 type:complete len:89 (-) Transcript_7743:458-724(-)
MTTEPSLFSFDELKLAVVSLSFPFSSCCLCSIRRRMFSLNIKHPRSGGTARSERYSTHDRLPGKYSNRHYQLKRCGITTMHHYYSSHQ